PSDVKTRAGGRGEMAFDYQIPHSDGSLGRGSVLNFASMNSYRPLTRVPAYAMAKAGVVNFTAWLCQYLAPAGIRVNAIAPG
ncbi:SDR family NAD(P)-dependent oxidoreductase, partial [Bacillus sp. SIMBA_161]